MKKFLANFVTDILTAWIIVGCGAVAIQHNTAFWLQCIMWIIIFVTLDVYIYIKNKIK